MKQVGAALAVFSVLATVYYSGLTLGRHFERASSPAASLEAPEVQAPSSRVPNAPRAGTELRSRMWRATLAQVARDFGIEGRLDCRAVQERGGTRP